METWRISVGRKKAGRGEMPGLSWEERDGEIGGKLEGRQGVLQDTRSVEYLPTAPYDWSWVSHRTKSPYKER